MQQKETVTESPDKTEEIAYEIGKNLRGGEVIELTSDLGGGKTTFTRGLVKGMGSDDNVSSPTFTIGKQYKSKELICYHFDFYRLQEAGLVAEELAEALKDPKAVIVIEWAQSIVKVLPQDRINISMDKLAEDPESRKLDIKFADKFSYLLDGVSI